ncbi:MAG TPA: sugar phosphate isomerase/epimerase family protein [Gemmatales bacterium]|nr:sugar phosphate isomerase/epimerase family protein [Gemmatales bacterium]HMP60046.1 sugar phosphate isomerase/epimerase family protein [Gemmatales bacterium]
MPAHLDRRCFLQGTLAGAVALSATGLAFSREVTPKLKKAIKYGMVKGDLSHRDRFELVKKIGFEGVEIDSPNNYRMEELLSARDATGLPIHGVINSIHWNVRLSDPKPEVRTKARAGMVTALDDAAAVGADTVLLVPGVVDPNRDGDFDTVWQRSADEIRMLIPEAERRRIKIAIEVVWNNFITTPDQLCKFVDQFESPWVGAYFDCSNMIKYGVKSGDWIRKLGPRMLKFDFKGYSKEKGWVKIGEGDEDWPDVLKACAEIGYEGWATAEVAGGGEPELRDVYERMGRVLGG